MLTINIPGFKKEKIELNHLVPDFNGTLAIDGKLIAGAKEKLIQLSQSIQIQVITGNTFGTAEKELEGIDCQLVLLERENQKVQKSTYTKSLDNQIVISIGNGNNDQLLLKTSVIGICVLQEEGISIPTLQCSDLCYKDINDALLLILQPQRLMATLRG